MGAMDLDEFRDALWPMLENNSEVDPSLGITATLRLDRWINSGYMRVARPSTFRHMETETTSDLTLVEDDDTYTLPSTLWAIDHIYYVGQGFSLGRMIRREMSNRTLGTGMPRAYSRWGRTIYLDTTPSSSEDGDTLRVFGWLIPMVLSDENDQTILTYHWDEVILEWAASMGWNSLGNPARADYHRERYAAMVNDVREVLDEESRDTGGDFQLEYTTQDTMRRA